jgi:type IX secretion system PorP/SprF family membrane protein
MFNTLAINPAYAGSQEDLSVTALMREQWVGLDGAPSTQTLSAHTPFEKKRIGVGLLVVHDKIGITDQTDLYASYAYKIPMKKGTLSLGLQGGFLYYKANFSEVSLTDPTFQGEDLSEFLPNFGAGVYYSTDRFYAGIGVPQLIQSKVDKGNVASESKLIRHYFVHSGYVFDLNQNLKLKPNVLFKIVDGAPLEIDLNANLYFHDLVGLGLSWRSMDAIVMLLQIQITDRLQFGYAYDFGTTALRQVHSGSHELFLNYRFSLSKSKIITPRYF